MNLEAAELNAVFGEHLGTNEGIEKLGSVMGTFIQEKYRESAFTNRVLPPETVTEAELTRSVSDESLIYIDDIEPDSRAMRTNWRSEPIHAWLSAPRYEIRFTQLSTPVFIKTEQELRSYKMPITKVLEVNLVKDLEAQVDVLFMEKIRAAVMFATQDRVRHYSDLGQFSNAYASGGSHWLQNPAQLASYLYTGKVALLANGGSLATVSTLDGAFTAAHANYAPVTALKSNILMVEETEFSRTVLRDLIRIPTAREMDAKVILMHKYDFDVIVGWADTEAGLNLTSEIVIGGYKHVTLGGYHFATTVRDNPSIIQPGQIFVFPAPNFMGRNLSLGKLQFQMKRELGAQIQMMAWMEVGIGIGNVKGIGMALLAGASVTLPSVFFTNADGAYTGAQTFTLTNNPAAPLA